jgi:hypothetical protein
MKASQSCYRQPDGTVVTVTRRNGTRSRWSRSADLLFGYQDYQDDDQQDAPPGRHDYYRTKRERRRKRTSVPGSRYISAPGDGATFLSCARRRLLQL